MKSSKKIASVSLLLLLTGLLVLVPGGAGAANKTTSIGNRSTGVLTPIRTVNVGQLDAVAAAGAESSFGTEIPNHPTEIEKDVLGPTTTLPVPTTTNTPIAATNPRMLGFSGLNHADQRLAANGQQFSLEPPDQGLCTGGKFVVESVNDALMIYDKHGLVLLSAPLSISQFYGLANPITRPDPLAGGGPPFGPFVSDPKCYFDSDTSRWFASVLEIDVDPDTGAFLDSAATLLAVSQNRDPRGSWFIYSVDATDLSHPNCPCFGDQPLIGADQYGFYISTAEYSLEPFGAFSNFAQLYAIDKAALTAGGPATFTQFSDLTTTSGTMQPAFSPGGVYQTADGGTEYLVSGYDCGPPACALVAGQQDQLDVWALTGTSSIPGGGGSLVLSESTITTEVYGQPLEMTQKDGPRPLSNIVNEPLERLNANDERVNQVVYQGGTLWTGLNTILQTGPQIKTGIAWFILDPSAVGGGGSASVVNQGYLAVDQGAVSFPSIGVNASGGGIMTYTLVGKNYFPSSAYTDVSVAGAGEIHIARTGLLPDDGFTGYPSLAGGDGVARWGDYSAAVADAKGRVWFASEYIGGDPRTILANWSTFVARVNPPKQAV